MQIYEDRKNLFRPFLFGVTLTYVAIDNILNGPLREYMSKYFDLKEFGTNTREEYLYYLILFLGVLQILLSLQSLFLPVIEVIDTKIVLRTKEKTLSVIRDVSEIKNLNIKDNSYLVFSFDDAQYNVNVKDVLANDISDLYTTLNIKEEDKTSRKID